MRESEIRRRLAEADLIITSVSIDGPLVCLYLVAAFDSPPTRDGTIPTITVTRIPPKASK